MTPLVQLYSAGIIIGLILFVRHEIRTFPSYVILRVDTKCKNNPDLIIGISKIVEKYSKTVIDERLLITNPRSYNYGKLCVRISTMVRHKDNIIKDISQYMTQGFAYLSYEIES